MRNTILGALAGLFIGSAGALAYDHFLGDGSLLADLQAKLDAANAALAKSDEKKKELSQENTSLTSQVDQLQASNDDLKQKSTSAPEVAPAAGPSATELAAVASVLRDMMRAGPGNFRNPQQRMFLLQTRLKLSSEQAAKISAAMQADDRARRDLMRQMFQNGGKIDPKAAAAANTTDSTIQQVLNPDQLRQYAQLQTDEKNARADTSANSQVNSVAPLLQLSDTQKDQVYSALYQVQQAAPDPSSFFTNPNPFSAMKAQADATTAAMQKVLSPDQMSLYQQEQSMGWQPGRGRGGNNGGGNNGGQPGGGQGGSTAAAAPAPSPTPAPAPVAVAPANPAPAMTSDTSSPSSGTNAPSSSTDTSTNAASTNSAPTTNAPAASQ